MGTWKAGFKWLCPVLGLLVGCAAQEEPVAGGPIVPEAVAEGPVDADTLGGHSFNEFALDGHGHSAEDVGEGVFSVERLPEAVTFDDEIWSIVRDEDGSGSGLDGDLLDGQDGSYYLDARNLMGVIAEGSVPSSIARVAEVFSTVLEQDGTGSTLDADVLDGRDGAYYLSGYNITGLIKEESVPETIARLTDVMGVVLAADGSESTLDADTLDGLEATAFSPVEHFHSGESIDEGIIAREHLEMPVKVAVVAVSGGDYTNPVSAMENRGEWCGEPSSSNRCLLRLMPGVYNIDSSTLVMEEYIDVAGSGSNVTVIRGAGSGSYGRFSSVVAGASYSELRGVAIVNDGGKSFARGVHYEDAVGARIQNVSVEVNGGLNENIGVMLKDTEDFQAASVDVNVTGGAIVYGVEVHGARESRFLDCRINVHPTGDAGHGVYIRMQARDVTIKRSEIHVLGEGDVAAYGIEQNMPHPESTLRVIDSVVRVATGAQKARGIYNYAGKKTSVRSSRIEVSSTGTVETLGIYDVFADSVTTIRDSEVSAVNGATHSSGAYALRQANGATTRVANSFLNGRVEGTSCLGNYDTNFHSAWSTSCELLP